MTATPAHRKAAAALQLAAGKSQRAAAEAAEVSPGTVARWLRDPVFAEVLEESRAFWEQKPVDGHALMALMDEVEKRLAPEPAVRVEGGRFHVSVTVPAGASARQREKLTARAIARGLRAVRREAEA